MVRLDIRHEKTPSFPTPPIIIPESNNLASHNVVLEELTDTRTRFTDPSPCLKAANDTSELVMFAYCDEILSKESDPETPVLIPKKMQH